MTDAATRTRPTTAGRVGSDVPGGTSRRGRRRIREHRPLWLMLPAGILLLVIIIVPFAIAIWISGLDLDAYSLRHWVSAPFIGLSNYSEALRASGLLHSLGLSVAFAVLTTVIITPIGVMGALTVHQKYRGRSIIRSIYLLPYVIPSFVTALVWRLVLRPDGALNTALKHVGINGGNWLIGGRSFWSLILVDVWASWAFVYLMSLAGLQTIDPQLYEAADLDGTGWWQKIWHVVLPQMRGPLTLALLLSTLNHFNNFTLPFVLFGIPAPDAVNVLPINIYTTSFQVFRFGLGAAMSIMALVILVIPAVLYLRAVRLDPSPEA
jgi:multiple sugar transport system permease protein